MSGREQDIGGERVDCIDALRGFDMFWLIGGSAIFMSLHIICDCSFTRFIVKELTRAPWTGFTFEDLIMPLFLFICGVVLPYSLARRKERGHTKGQLMLHLLGRSIILFILGMVVQGKLLSYDLSRLHIFCNTLQAIAVGYFVTGVLMLYLPLWVQAVAAAGLLGGYWYLMTTVPVPEYEAGVLTQEGNLALYIDKAVLGRFEDGTPYTWVLSSMTFAATVMLGAFAGRWLRSGRDEVTRAVGLVGAGAAAIAAGWLWGFKFPIIKHLWTSSFVLYSAGLCLLLLAFFYLVIDVWGWRKWAFGFIVIGRNSIAAYMAVMLFDFRRVGGIFVNGLSGRLGAWNAFAQEVAAFAVLWLILWWMYRKKSFIKI